MKETVLNFPDGRVYFFFDDNRKYGILQVPGEQIRINNVEITKVVYKRMKMSFGTYKKRYINNKGK